MPHRKESRLQQELLRKAKAVAEEETLAWADRL
jgi:hypothetical protein